MHHRELYDDPTFGGADPGAAFEEYLTRLDLSGIWVADHPEDGVVGMVGLLLKGRAGEVEPVVVAEHRRGQGIGRALITELLARAHAMGKTQMVAAVDGDNEASLQFHERLGFVEVARMPAIGFKFGRWLDLVLLQRPTAPDPAR